MTRITLAAALATFAVGSAAGQGIREPRPTAIPRNGNTLPAQWWSPGPGMPMYYGPAFGPTSVMYYSPWYLPWGYEPNGFGQILRPPTPVPLVGAGVPTDTPVLIDPRLTAEFVVEFPASAEVWVNGKKLNGHEAIRTISSPPLKRNQTYSFAVKATWTLGGDAYEWERTLTLGAGERSKATVVTGYKMKE